MIKQALRLDWLITGVVIVILGFGLLAVRSIAPHLFAQQLAYAIFGLVLFLIFAQIDWRIYSRFPLLLYLGSLFLLGTTFLFGTITRGAVRWIEIEGLTIQPSELAKPLLILFFAWFFAEEEKIDIARVFLGGLFLLLPAFLVFAQPDLGSAFIIVLFWLGIVFAAGVSWRWLVSGAGIICLALPIIWRFLKEYQKQRIYTFLNPALDPLSSGYNIIQSIIAVGSGQLFGRGLGMGTQSHLRFLPERHSDFIFASLAEELGFLGTMVLLSFFALLLWRILETIHNTNNRFAMLACAGVFTMIFSQIFINVGMNIGLLPVTGVTLPLISSGGSSLVAILVSLGVIQNIAGFIRENEVKYFP